MADVADVVSRGSMHGILLEQRAPAECRVRISRNGLRLAAGGVCFFLRKG
ncbi:hypothetical protein DSM19430T_16820 [Desulfovibrio psychrotolerans]|uniref:Uncharacterized protein n=1 Tax=Desulfovibrio psychrotolerans TaxID=415242 RepID=A0A7J0BTK2_9BACT|nr:hypothetical protein DSM19430T_16820 [Desulfovibrio psychrotolerans]